MLKGDLGWERAFGSGMENPTKIQFMRGNLTLQNSSSDFQMDFPLFFTYSDESLSLA